MNKRGRLTFRIMCLCFCCYGILMTIFYSMENNDSSIFADKLHRYCNKQDDKTNTNSFNTYEVVCLFLDNTPINDSTPLRLVMAYMRSGSTLTADLIRHTDGDFYQFEPLFGIHSVLSKNGTTIQFLNGTQRNLTSDCLSDLYPEMMYHWLNCNFDDIDIDGLTSIFISIFTPEHEDYVTCADSFNDTNNRTTVVKKCIHLLQRRCITAKTRTIKTIRLSMSMAGKLLAWLPRLRIVHLIRDPRGILNSQLEQGLTGNKNVSTRAEEQCNQISSDLSTYDDLGDCFKDRIMRVNYEDICKYPSFLVPDIYRFLGSRFDVKVKEYMNRILKGPVKACGYCTDRGDAMTNAYRWLTVIQEQYLDFIDQKCSFLYVKLGYRHLEYNDLNQTKHSRMLENIHMK